MSVVTNPSPAAVFRCSARAVKDHHSMVETNTFEDAIRFALLEYQHKLSAVQMDNFNQCAAHHLKITGAQEFVRILRNLADTETPPPAQSTGNLNHRA